MYSAYATHSAYTMYSAYKTVYTCSTYMLLYDVSPALWVIETLYAHRAARKKSHSNSAMISVQERALSVNPGLENGQDFFSIDDVA